ncbi:MAG: adenylyltransferase/cytidyltransferase family protein [Firmicutes bacterium]|nr:adenylyltransferase/cytidyltransferase family protein [Bacillota bacterium]
MKKVITYGTYDLLHYGHIKLLERAKALGDYLIVGVTADDFDKTRGKINVRQTLEERIAAVRAVNIADQIIVEQYEGQKIDDIKRYDVDVFTVGSDWEGVFDYLREYCEVIYLPRTQGISSTDIRSSEATFKIGMTGYSSFLNKFYKESTFVNAVDVIGLYSKDTTKLSKIKDELEFITNDYDELLENVDSVYIHSHPSSHYSECKKALLNGKNVLCESPVAMSSEECNELLKIAKDNGLTFMEAIRTAYTTAYSRLLLLLKSGKIGKVVSVDATCTSLSSGGDGSREKLNRWGSLEAWGPTTLLPVFQILGTDYESISFFFLKSSNGDYDSFTKIDFKYSFATASIKVGNGVKSEGELIISGTKGYVYVPAPWWKMDYFEIRYENPTDNKRYFYQINGEGIRYELVEFANAIRRGKPDFYIDRQVTIEISKIMHEFYSKVK